MDVLVVMVVMEYQVLLVLQGEMVEMAKWGNLVPWVPLDPWDPLALSMGLVYTRWGRTTCPSTSGTQLVYSGRAAGSHAFHKGGGSDILCLPDDPEYSDYAPGVQGTSSIYGAEYWPTTEQPLNSARQHNMPCAVCCSNW